MKPEMSKPSRRLAVITNYGCILLFLVFFSIGKYNGWSLLVVAGATVALIAALLTFLRLHLRTHFWKLVHTTVDKLDERQVQTTHQSLRCSYRIFTVVSLLVLMSVALLAGEHDSTLVLIIVSLLYLAHTLPSSVMAWTKKEIQPRD